MGKLEFNISWRDIFYGVIILFGIAIYCFSNRYAVIMASDRLIHEAPVILNKMTGTLHFREVMGK